MGDVRMKFAYADPPYIGQAKKHYAADPRCAEVDHAELITRLLDEYSDGWALSLSTPSLKRILSLCPDSVRTMAWVKPFCAFKANVGLAYAWEPVIFYGGRRITRKQPTVRDWHSASITLKKGLSGAKPPSFCHWVLDALNFTPGDSLDDLFPGTGVMGECVRQRSAERPFGTTPMFTFDDRSLVNIEDGVSCELIRPPEAIR
jgi:hypothetical protein